MNFLGLIVKCRNGKFVKVEKEGIFQLTDISAIEGYAGREITQLGEPQNNYLVWNLNGDNTRSREWDLVETCTEVDEARIEKGWPRETT
jgi:hypothetical protein